MCAQPSSQRVPPAWAHPQLWCWVQCLLPVPSMAPCGAGRAPAPFLHSLLPQLPHSLPIKWVMTGLVASREVPSEKR